MMKKYLLTLGLVLSSFFCAESVFAGGSEVTITKEGKTTASEVRVMQIAGPTLYTRLYWGDAYIRLLVKGSSATKVFRSTGEEAKLSDISEGDVLTIEGVLEPGGTALVLIPSIIRNNSDQKKQVVLAGTVTSVDVVGNRVLLSTKKYGAVSATISTTTQIIKGSRVVPIANIKAGDIVKQASGSLNMGSRVLDTSGIVIYLDPKLFEPQLYIMKLASVALSATGTVSSLTGSYDGRIYTLFPSTKTTYLNKNKEVVNPSRFVVGDLIRVWGAVRETDEPLIDVEVVRNMNL